MPAAKQSSKPRPGKGCVDGGRFHDYNPMKVDPKREQFAPTEAQPIRQRARMGGDPAPELSVGQKLLLLPKNMTDRQLMEAKGAGDPKSDVGKERIKRINAPTSMETGDSIR